MPLLTLPGIPASHRARALVFEDPVSRALLRSLDELGPSEPTVLITGETGTGKEIVARYLHDHGARRDRPFVAVNCGAISASLVESELFGHERGAFTGAAGARPGLFEAAHGGTLFLDELGELPAAIQVKLLRVLQEHEVVRLGARQPIPIDVRLIAATNANLEREVAHGRFRADLYYRVHVAAIELPPLRERPGDILPLARYFAVLSAERAGRRAPELTPAAVERLLAHPWPGNIRELDNVIQRAVLACRDGQIHAEQLRFGDVAAIRPAIAVVQDPPATTIAQSAPSVRAVPIAPTAPTVLPASPLPEPIDALEAALDRLFDDPPPELYARIEHAVIRSAYRYCDGNQLQTARLLGISRNIVRARLIQFGEIVGTLRGSGAVPAEALAAAADDLDC